MWLLVLGGAGVLGAFGLRSSEWVYPNDNPFDVSCGPFVYCVGDDCSKCVLQHHFMSA